MAEHVTILGDGAMATVCSILLTQGGHSVTMWGAFEDSIERLVQNREQSKLLPGARIPPNVRLTANDAECFKGATLVLSAVPTQYMRAVWQRLGPHLPPSFAIVSVAKGIENNTLLRPTQIIQDVLGKIDWATDDLKKRDGETAGRGHGGTEQSVESFSPSPRLSVSPSPHPSVPPSPRPPVSPSSHSVAALSGPNIAAELAKCLPATAVAASAD